MKNLFKDIGELDYILIVNNSSKTRFTSRDLYILDIIYGIFGKNIIERLMFICTFSDGEKPLVIDTLKSVGYYYFQEYFCFNNSCLYVSNNNADKVTKDFWKIGNTSIKKFLDIIIQKILPPLSLDMSNQAMENRDKLFSIGKSSKERVNKTLNYLEDYRTLSKLKRKDRKESMLKLGKEIEELIKLISDDINLVKNA